MLARLMPVRNLATTLTVQRVPHELPVFASGVHRLPPAEATADDGGRMLNPAVQVRLDLAPRWPGRQHEQPRGTERALGTGVGEGG
ncbi:hypothetical protein E5F05_00230 (plasmid) [Deinococcus metallilatus]|uniref:Uncharacterized protein n=1 Tax=Deinococcus metallilatus TaxID=1211322 RepID=A0AAJ5F776_9DEIO|nr:hypothetical protein [Deinococcus metallilatus]MBB5293324.1 hypothetical protein [Deinococcus metallilatus]QBY06431.1 hypothetical protein E5F05_00230 [Deinococcus metallilatus]RXJ18110.1 hypothetical protein ERJ73_01745 [Deinococcus metallilatus]TLK32046.1 hypothetical protein FCS05_00860 [Deinococcus metallilatus]GMA15453.1 hypothetical protein GCM10025871_17840 [Deinococcus metallilatus]